MFNNTIVYTAESLHCPLHWIAQAGRRPGTRYWSILLKNIACSVVPIRAGGREHNFYYDHDFHR